MSVELNAGTRGAQRPVQIPAVALRPADEMMRLARLGSLHPTRISFVRTLVRRMARERWRISCDAFELDDEGYGTAVYSVSTPAGRLSFVAFSDYLDAEDRTDRVIATRWDAAFVLTTAEPDAATLRRLRANAPRQEAGRYRASELVLSRANKSVRMFDYVAQTLASGRQPDPRELVKVGYLVRTTAVYGNGKFGLADFEHVVRGGIFRLPFQAEMLTVYLARHFSLELVQHIARRRSPRDAVALDPGLGRGLGVGNATGLGMAPFLATHPKLIHQWIYARELGLARVRAMDHAEPERLRRLDTLLRRALAHLAQWSTADARQSRRIAILRSELAGFREACFEAEPSLLPARAPWDFAVRWAQVHASPETQELLNSLLLELYPELVDELENHTGSDESEDVVAHMPLRELKSLLEQAYDWAVHTDFGAPEAQHFFWYWSAEKLEPRLGVRAREPGADREMRIDVAREVAQLYRVLAGLDGAEPERSVAEFLLAYPQWRRIVRRVQTLAGYPYAEIRDNILARDCLPIDLLRCKLSVFGAAKFDPRSDRWTRITLFQGAPLADELTVRDPDDWCFPVMPGALGETSG
jgi:hypothetical protein